MSKMGQLRRKTADVLKSQPVTPLSAFIIRESRSTANSSLSKFKPYQPPLVRHSSFNTDPFVSQDGALSLPKQRSLRSLLSVLTISDN